MAGRLVVRSIATAYLSLVVCLMFWAHTPRILGWEPRVVVTGSMAPGIRPGDVALIGPGRPGIQTLPPGRIVLIETPEKETGYTLHRLQRYEADGMLVMKGDANPTSDPQPVPIDAVRGQLRLLVPFVGLPVVWFREQNFAAIIVVALLTFLALATLDRSRPRRYRLDLPIAGAARTARI